MSVAGIFTRSDRPRIHDNDPVLRPEADITAFRHHMETDVALADDVRGGRSLSKPAIIEKDRMPVSQRQRGKCSLLVDSRRSSRPRCASDHIGNAEKMRQL